MDMTQTNLQRQGTETRPAPIAMPVDIFEDAEGITLRADMPGVSRDSLAIGVDGDTLAIEGAMSLGESARLDDVYAEIRVAQYKRSFVLGRDLDTGRIEATLKNGVLTLRIPKAEEARPRRISVKAE